MVDWIPAISTTTFLAAGLWLARNLIMTRLTNAVRHEYDNKLETLKSEFSQKQELLKADLRAKELQLESIKTVALSGITQRQTALFEKQVTAIEVLWSQVIDLAPVKGAAQSLAVIKFDVAIKTAAENENARQMFEMLGGHVDLQSVDTKDSHKVRPFISPLAWAYFYAYAAILGHVVFKYHMLKKGLDYPQIIETSHLKKVIITALPHQKEYIESVDPESYFHLLDELETSMLRAFDNTLKGVQEDKATLLQAAEIIKASEDLTNTDLARQEGNA
ncbi:hypothetical protein BCT75_08960 [Vibrio lentus]|uniref:hypothetical protein n=1 Tax=Vibrio lentus TaxID=136468 RepID=UPI000C8561EE|nr:hypothetical protein [Vibrio lentus]PML51784.1 hypothetical protein BCT75_08960 [Vibrio lentus]